MWKQIDQLRLDSFVRWNRDDLRLCDPYLVWAEASTTARLEGFAGKADELAEGPDQFAALPGVAVLVELHRPDGWTEFWECLTRGSPDELPILPNGFEPLTGSCFITGHVTRWGLERLVELVKTQVIARFTLQDSRRHLAKQMKSEYAIVQARCESQDKCADESAERPKAPTQQDAQSRGTGTFLGLIDDGLPFVRVRSTFSSHVEDVHLWDQGWEPQLGGRSGTGKPGGGAVDDGDPDWVPPWDLYLQPVTNKWEMGGFFYGRRLKLPADAAQSGELARDSAQTYFRSRYFTPAPRQSHGAAVLGLLAPWLVSRPPIAWPGHISGLSMVQLPTRTVNDTSGGSLSMRVLDALRFILWRERRTRPQAQQARPVLVNLSYGVYAGPHDGTSMIERAFLEALENNPHLHLVLPAGNAHRLGSHAQLFLTARGTPKAKRRMHLHVLADNGVDCFIEIWIPAGADVAIVVRPPGMTDRREVRRGQAWLDCRADQQDQITEVHFAVIYPDAVAQGTRGTMALLAIGATRPTQEPSQGENGPRGANQRPRRKVSALPGLWEVEVRNLGLHSVQVDAWAERGDAPPDQVGGSRQAHFPDSCDEQRRQENSTPEGTINGIANLRHDRAHVVGAMRSNGVLSDYSAAGPERSAGLDDDVPDIVAIADWSLAVPGVKSMGFTAGGVTRINGTSAACAVYARALAERLAESGPHSPPPAPPPATPEISCGPERQPAASPHLRGESRREHWPFEVFEVDRWLREQPVGSKPQ